MGQAESQPQTGGAAGPTNSHGGGSSTTLAFHVLRVAENSPAAEAGIEPFFDFVVGAAGKQLVRCPCYPCRLRQITLTATGRARRETTSTC